MNSRRITLLLLLGAAIAVLLYLANQPAAPTPDAQPASANFESPASVDSVAPTPPPVSEELRPAPIGQPATQPLPAIAHPDPAMRSPLADELLDRDGTGTSDLRIVMTLCEHFLEKCGGMPVGTNPEIVNALTGNNPHRLAFLPRDHPAINGAGELVDRWGTPFFFHNVARDLIGIRSAGPDREMFSADDLLQQSPRLEATGR